MSFRREIINEKPVILIFRKKLLHISESFIREQCNSAERYNYRYVGLRVVEGINLPKEETFTVSDGSLIGFARETAYSFLGADIGLTNRLSELKPALMHAHFGPDGVCALRASRRLKIPLVVTFHGYDATTDHNPGLANFNKFNLAALKAIIFSRWYHKNLPVLFDGADLVIAVSEFIKRKLIKLGAPEEKIVRHYIGVDIEKFKPDPGIKREPIVLFVGRLAEVKGCSYLIKAMEEAQKTRPDARLIIIGDGPLRASLEELAKEKLQNYRFLGFQPSEEVRRWMNLARVLCVPSVKSSMGAEEGFGLVFIEAAAMGLPAVSSISGGIVEAVEHGQTGLLAQEKDWEALALYITTLLNDDDLWKEMSDRCRDRTAKKFDIRTQTIALEEIYETIIQGKNR